MPCVGRVCAAGLLAAAVTFGASPALAEALVGAQQPLDRMLLFSGLDLWRNGGAVHGGLLWSPGGLAREGFTLKLLVAGGRYEYRAGATEIVGQQWLASAMAGWRFKRDRLEITVFAGPDLQSHALSPDDPNNRLRGTLAGARVGADLWYQPSDTFMAAASVSASTVGENYWVRGAVGWDLFGRAWVGPEVMTFGSGHYRQFRVGMHATAYRTADFEFSAGVGYAHDSDDRDGLYTRIGVMTRR